ncbi:hypothetical protein GCM10027456_48500 [Kineosporia babensis]|uniref:HTH domain-containing protein n=1 Tax=Kineosporia babensis TaxID=499548 RepID=A0A9X1NN06_9ACTN|nr:helix-turn-helix domain-containing protein [Kineosporia babensis]MCD5317168.1 HTH domain-containing protein [Kineosporia babensis]
MHDVNVTSDVTPDRGDETDARQASRAVVSPRRRAWPVLLLALPAFVAIWSGWVELGGMTGFGEVKPLPGIAEGFVINTAITLPIGVETYAAYALNVWLSGGTSRRATRFARASALGSLALGAGGQIAYHLMKAAGIVQAPWWITAVVACLPVAVLGMGAALHHLVSESADPHEAPAPAEAVNGGDTPDEAEARTERIVIENAMRERHPQWPTETVTEIAGALAAEGGQLPTPAPRTRTPEPATDPAEPGKTDGVDGAEESAPKPVAAATVPRPVVRATTTGAGGGKPRTDTAARVQKLRDKHPEWTAAQIATRAGVTERTVRRHLNTSTTPTDPSASGEAPSTAAA